MDPVKSPFTGFAMEGIVLPDTQPGLAGSIQVSKKVNDEPSSLVPVEGWTNMFKGIRVAKPNVGPAYVLAL